MNLLCCKFKERRFCQNKYRASLGDAMRAQGFALSKMKGTQRLPSSKFGVPSTKDMYSGWSKRSYSHEKKSWLAHLSAKTFSLYITLLQFCFLKEDYSVHLYRRGNRLDIQGRILKKLK